MALILSSSASVVALSSPSSSSSKSLRAFPCMISNDAQNHKRSNKVLGSCSPLKVATPQTIPPTSEPEQSIQTKEEEEVKDYEIEDESSSSKFSWRDHWYPVSLIEDLDPRLPTPFQLMGRDLVLWNDKSTGSWIAFDDKCPHRLAPLSVSFIG